MTDREVKMITECVREEQRAARCRIRINLFAGLFIVVWTLIMICALLKSRS